MKRAFLALFFLAALPAAAQDPIGDIVTGYQSSASIWTARLLPYAQGTFAALATFGLLRMFLVGIARRNSRADFLGAAIVRLLVLSIGWAILNFYPLFVPPIIDGFATVGTAASGLSSLSPTAIVVRGLMLSQLVVRGAMLQGFLDSTPWWTHLPAVLILLSFFVIAAQVLLTLVEVIFAVAIGIFPMAFAGDGITGRIADNLFAELLRLGFKLLVLYALVGTLTLQSAHWLQLLATNAWYDLGVPLTVSGAALIAAILVWVLPQTLSSRLTAGVNFGFADALRAL